MFPSKRATKSPGSTQVPSRVASAAATSSPGRKVDSTAAVAAEQVLGLVDRGVSDFHFYTMNRADLVFEHFDHVKLPSGEDIKGRRIGFRNVGARARADDVRLHVASDARHGQRKRPMYLQPVLDELLMRQFGPAGEQSQNLDHDIVLSLAGAGVGHLQRSVP